MAVDLEIWQHKEWLGLLQPVGLVVSPLALTKYQAVVNKKRAITLQQKLEEVVSRERYFSRVEEGSAWIPDFAKLAVEVLEWLPEDLVGMEGQKPLPEELEIPLIDYGETLKPTYAVADPDSGQWVLLIQNVKIGYSLDEVTPDTEKRNGWKATVQAKFERLLRETRIPIGILSNGSEIRLVYAPRGESSGYLTFPVQAMTEVSGRLILGALEMLIGADRLFNVGSDRRLDKILSNSREYQAEVSNKLADQVLDALWELLKGFQTADAQAGGVLLQELAKTRPQHIYGGLITTLMRLVFLLYAEDEGLMPDDPIYQQNYSVSGLYERLREDSGNFPDTMDLRYGAWPWILSLFRLVYDGGGPVPEYLPARHGQLFDPQEYPFLEGRQTSPEAFSNLPSPLGRGVGGEGHIPRLPDGVIYRVLDKLLMLEGERLSYRSLDVEQIGSVYEAIMGYEVEQAIAPSIGVKAKPKGTKFSTTVVINLGLLLQAKPSDRAKLLKDWAECEITANNLKALKEARTIEALIIALERKVSEHTPNILPAGSLYLQPGEERRRSGSHYTPRQLTQPIVEATLAPIFQQLGEHPNPEQILELKICDLAMGSAAFLVETCRQLAEKLVEAYEYHGLLTQLPPDLEPLLYARRLVAQRCLYGVDRNPFAVNLAKLSLWLVTLAKDLPFTFVDHALKCGDSLVGLTRREIGSFGEENLPLLSYLKEKTERIKNYRNFIQVGDTRTDADADNKLQELRKAEEELEETRLIANVKVAAFFSGNKDKERADKLSEYGQIVRNARENLPSPLGRGVGGEGNPLQIIADQLHTGGKTLKPFNWELEFPEVFESKNPGFDAIIGNPPFAGKNTIINGNLEGYLDWLKIVHPESHGNADLVAHFFRRAFTITRKGGTLGLIATNTIAQGDTRSSGLRFICHHKGIIYNARKRVKWPGLAAVVISVVHIYKDKK